MSALRKLLRLRFPSSGIGSCILPVWARQGGAWSLVVAAMLASTGDAFAGSGPNVGFPFADDFEAYPTNTPLIDGTNGWYGSASYVVVVSNNLIAPAGSTNIAMIPEDCTLSNRFVAGTPFNVRVAMNMRPARYDYAETNFPAVDTNATAMFYVDTNGHFVVCNGLGTTSAWCMVSNAFGTANEFLVVPHHNLWVTSGSGSCPSV